MFPCASVCACRIWRIASCLFALIEPSRPRSFAISASSLGLRSLSSVIVKYLRPGALGASRRAVVGPLPPLPFVGAASGVGWGGCCAGGGGGCGGVGGGVG